MSFIKGLAKAGIAQRLYTEARKPENQRRAKDLYAKLRAKRAARTARPTRPMP